MKSVYGLLAVGLLCFGLYGSACVSGDTVSGDGSGGRTGSNTGNGGSNSSGLGGFVGTGFGGSVTGGLGGFVGGGLGGFVGGGQGGTITGAAGSGVSGCPRSVPLIDNFDEPNRGGPATGGYFNVNCGIGSWYVYGDATATATVMPPLSSPTSAFTSSMPGNGGAGYAAHVNGSGFANYGVGFGVNINTMGATIMPYNATGYSGISFFIMGTATSTDGANMIRVSIPTPSTSSAPSGGTCAATATTYCDGHWGKVIPVTAAWTKVTILFSELTKDPNAGGAPFSSSTIIGVHWQAGASATAVPAVVAAMNVWVDDLSFVP